MKKKIFTSIIHDDVMKNQNFRHVVATYGKKLQLVLYKLKMNESIERELHKKQVQLIYVVDGNGSLIIDHGNTKKQPEIIDIYKGLLFIIPNGVYHYIVNDSKDDLRFYSIYSPSEFKEGRIDKNVN